MAGQRRIDADDDSCMFSYAYRAVEEEAMKLEWDEEKRLWTLERKGLDFADVLKVLEETYIVQPDDRRQYPEARFLTYGFLLGRLIMFAWTPTSGGMRIISMRKCNDREQRKFGRWVG